MKLYNIGITGYSGSIGRALLKHKHKYFKFIKFKGDVRHKKKLLSWFSKNNFNAIIHLAAVVPIVVVNRSKKNAYNVNYNGTKNIVDLVAKFNVKWFFFASTSHVYKSQKKKISEQSLIKPISYYGKTKYLAEQYIKKKKINYCIGRIFSTTNKLQKKNYLVPDLKNKSKKKGFIKLKNLNHFRDFISIEDIAKIILLLFKKNYKGVINIGTGKAIKLKTIAEHIFKKEKKKAEYEDNLNPTYLVAQNKKLKRLIDFKLNENILNMIY